MGKDIHAVLEQRTNSGWEFFDPGFEAYDLRFSSFFDFLSDAGDPGCPEELKTNSFDRRHINGETRTERCMKKSIFSGI